MLPADATQVYEDLRAAVLHGHADSRAMAAIVFHGLWHGLSVLVTSDLAVQPQAHVAPDKTSPPASTHDCQLVRQLANMVLAVQSQVQHAY